MLNYIDVVSSEAGPLLIADAIVAKKWQGTKGDGTHYAHAIKGVDDDSGTQGKIIQIENSVGLIWQMNGAGSCPVFWGDQNDLVVLQVWLEEPDDDAAASTLAALASTDRLLLGTIAVTTGMLAILWAAESGDCITGMERLTDFGRPQGEMGTDESALLIKISDGNYDAWYDFVQGDRGEARRLHLVKQQ